MVSSAGGESAGGPCGWSKAWRLRRRPDFVAVQDSDRRWAGRMLVLCVKEAQTTEPRFGLTVSRKVGGAVERNRIRRHLREALRCLRSRVVVTDVVFIARPAARAAGGAALADEVCRLLGRAKLLMAGGVSGGRGCGRDS